jgi:hypothetical protein
LYLVSDFSFFFFFPEFYFNFKNLTFDKLCNYVYGDPCRKSTPKVTGGSGLRRLLAQAQRALHRFQERVLERILTTDEAIVDDAPSNSDKLSELVEAQLRTQVMLDMISSTVSRIATAQADHSHRLMEMEARFSNIELDMTGVTDKVDYIRDHIIIEHNSSVGSRSRRGSNASLDPHRYDDEE